MVNGNLREILERLQIVRMHAVRVELAPVVRHIVVGVPHAPLQALQLQRAQLVAAGALDAARRSARRRQAEQLRRPQADRQSQLDGSECTLTAHHLLVLHAMGAAAQHGDDLAALVGDRDVVHAGASGRA